MTSDIKTDQHTPGPWLVGNGGVSVVVRDLTITDEPTYRTIASLPAINLGPKEEAKRPERNANARLIAAAPLMLDALRAIQRAMYAIHPDNGDRYCDACGEISDANPEEPSRHLTGCWVAVDLEAPIAAATGAAL